MLPGSHDNEATSAPGERIPLAAMPGRDAADSWLLWELSVVGRMAPCGSPSVQLPSPGVTWACGVPSVLEQDNRLTQVLLAQIKCSQVMIQEVNRVGETSIQEIGRQWL